MDTFSVGVGVRDITPEPGLKLWGYSGREGGATGTLDELYAQAIVFAASGGRVAWVTLDSGRVPLEKDCAVVRERCADLDLDAIIFHATHTHHAPAVESLKDPHLDTLLRGIEEAIRDAVTDLEPAKVGVGRCTIDIAHNRRCLTPHGHCLMRWRNEERVPTEPIDPEATVIKIDTANGRPKAILVHFACHPVVMGPSNMEYSADYVGTLRRIVKGMTDAECIFLQGACGDINPYLDKTHVDDGGIDAAFSMGRIAGEAVLAVAFDLQTQVPTDPSVGLFQHTLEVGNRWKLSGSEERATVEAAHPDLFKRYIANAKDRIELSISAVMLNHEVALVGIPGEVFVEQQLALKAEAPVAHALLCGYVDGYEAYFPPIRHASAGGYGGTVGTYVEVGTAERLYSEGLIALHRLSGRLSGIPTEDDMRIVEIKAQEEV